MRHYAMATNGAWDDVYQCPFCGDDLPSPGSGFVDHIAENQACDRAFDAWRVQITDDVPHGWPG